MQVKTGSVQNFELAPLSRSAQWFFPALWLALVALAFLLRHDALLRSNPTNPVPPWLVMFFGVALAVVGPFILLQYRRIRIVDGRLAIMAAGFFTHRIAPSELDLDKARIVDLNERTELKPALRLFGFGLPGFRAGHYLLRNRSRAFCLLTDFERVLVLPRRDGKKTVLLSPLQPQVLLSHLRELARG
jgi:hypothetical protein